MMSTAASTTTTNSTESVFEFEIPANKDEWGNTLIISLRNALDKLSNKFEQLRPSIVKELKAELVSEVQAVKQTANDALDLALANEATIKSMQEGILDLKIECSRVNQENLQLRQQCERQENYSRRDNLIIRGITGDDENETEEKCVDKLKHFFVNSLSLGESTVASMMFVRCHRLGKKLSNNDKRPRPLIVRFEHFADRKLVWGNRFRLAGTRISMSEHFATNVEYRRNKLYPILSMAKKSGKYNKKAYLNGDVLRINAIDYTVHDLEKLPADIHPHKLSFKSNADYIVFGGIHSEYNFLSNYANLDTNMMVKGQSYKTAEHSYHHLKAIRYKDSDSALRILGARDPGESKRIGQHIKNFKTRLGRGEGRNYA